MHDRSAAAVMIEPPALRGQTAPSVTLLAAGGVILLALAATVAGIWGGPVLGDHEGLVAECARQMRLTGNWTVPQFLGTPFERKPPLPYWLVAAISYLFPSHAATGLPVTPEAARLPSAIAAFGTILILWRLGSAMFGSRGGLVAAVMAASSFFLMLYGRNATAEMILTFCCTWAYAHFWFAVNARQPGRRRLHMVLFYVALGLGMLAKGPAPLAMVAVPLAAWWYLEKPLRLLARGCVRGACVRFLRGLWPQTRAAFTKLWLLPGLILFVAIFIPWMYAVARQHPHAWDMWNWQYWQRAQGNYEDTRPRGPEYYLKYIPAFLAPWVFLLPEALVAPWIRLHARFRRPLLFAGIWAVVGILVMSLEPFKKPYYIAPAVPGLILLLTPVALRLFSLQKLPRKLAWTVFFLLLAGSVAGLVAGFFWLRRFEPALMARALLIAVPALAAVIAAVYLFIRGLRYSTFWIMAFTMVAAFNAGWYFCGRLVDSLEEPQGLARILADSGVPADARVLWADGRPDSRLGFYFNRNSAYMITPAEIVTRMADRTQGKAALQEMVADRASELLTGTEPVYLILERGNYERFKMFVGIEGHITGEVKNPQSPRKSLLIVSNVESPAKAAAPR